ncbi:MAG: polysaccharide pyruvyl transferase family protein [Candidatus Nitrosocaldus sp.]
MSFLIKPKRILIIGGYGFSNIGDEAILGGLLKYLEDVLGYNKNIHKITVFSNNPNYTMTIHGIDAKKNIIHQILRSDIIIIGGGELFSEYKLLLYKNSFLVILARLLNKKIYLIGIGIDIKKLISKLLLKFVFRLVDSISVRDKSSMQILHDICINNVQLMQDLAFYGLRPIKSSLIDNFMKQHGLTPYNFIIIVIRPYDNSTQLSFYINIIKMLAKNNRVVLIPFSKHQSSHEDNDLNVIQQIKRVCEQEITIFDPHNTHPNVVLYFISMSKLVISSRLHPLIFAKVANVKSIAMLPLYQSKKVRTFAEENNIPIITPNNFKDVLGA